MKLLRCALAALVLALATPLPSHSADWKTEEYSIRGGAYSDSLDCASLLTSYIIPVFGASEAIFHLKSSGDATDSSLTFEVSNDSIGWRSLGGTYGIAGSTDTLVSVIGVPVGGRPDSTRAVTFVIVPHTNVSTHRPMTTIPYRWLRLKMRPRCVPSAGDGVINGYSHLKITAYVRRAGFDFTH